MPNWCVNDLKVRGDAKELSRFREFVKGGNGAKSSGMVEEVVLSFEKLVPIPEELAATSVPWSSDPEWQRQYDQRGDELEARLGYRGWYDFCCANWGTKWDADIPSLTVKPSGLCYHFDTAWSPPVPVVIAAARLFPSLSFELVYCEPGNGFSGIFECCNGVVLQDECEAWNASDEFDCDSEPGEWDE